MSLICFKKHGCDGVWPGWFCLRRCCICGWSRSGGYSVFDQAFAAMLQLGDKIAAKKLAEKAGVPLAPWAEILPDDDESSIVEKAVKIGFPLMLKASAGGGGRESGRWTQQKPSSPAISRFLRRLPVHLGPVASLWSAVLPMPDTLKLQLFWLTQRAKAMRLVSEIALFSVAIRKSSKRPRLLFCLKMWSSFAPLCGRDGSFGELSRGGNR